MISPRVARELQGKGFDVQAITGDRKELMSTPDAEIIRRIAPEPRAIVTNNVRDFRSIHEQCLSRKEEHAGMLFTLDATMPRNLQSIPLWINVLKAFLEAHPKDDEFKNRTKFLP